MNICQADKLFFHFFEFFLNGKSAGLSATFTRLLNFQKPGKLFFHFFEIFLNEEITLLAVVFLDLAGSAMPASEEIKSGGRIARAHKAGTPAIRSEFQFRAERRWA